MNAIIDAQGRHQKTPSVGRLNFDISSPATGVVVAIDNFHLARVARYAGAPMEKGAGVDLFKKLGDAVNLGEALYRVYSAYPEDQNFAHALCESQCGFTIGNSDQIPQTFVEP